MSCIRTTEEIEQFAKNFTDENIASITNLLGMYWEANPEEVDIIPDINTFKDFISNTRKDKLPKETSLSITDNRKASYLAFTPKQRKSRVSLIARAFRKKVSAELEKKRDAINRQLMETKISDDRRAALNKELYELNRISIIKELTPAGIFKSIRSEFEKYTSLSDEQRIALELRDLKKKKGADKYTDEQLTEAARKKAEYNNNEYKKITAYFYSLAEDTLPVLYKYEHIGIDVNASDIIEITDSTADENGISNEEFGEVTIKEETVKDSWMSSFREISSHDSLSTKVREIISEMPRVDNKGKVIRDDLGNIQYMDENYVHAVLMDKLRFMLDSDDMIPLLENLAKYNNWVNVLINKLKKDDVVFSQFYHDFQKTFMPYWVQRKIMNSDGTFKVQSFPVNKPEGIDYLLNAWRYNYDSGTVLSNNSIYDESSNIDKTKAKAILDRVNKLVSRLNQLTTENRFNEVGKDDTFNEIIDILHSIGIDPNIDLLKEVLTTNKSIEGIETAEPIQTILQSINIIASGLSKKIISNTDVINEYESAFSNIAKMIAEVTTDAIESSTREGDKTYYSHVNPSYLDKLIKNLKNVMNDNDRFKAFIEKEFGQYEWFKKDDRWRSNFIEKIATNPKFRELLDHKVVLNHDKIDYTDWDSIDYTVVMLNEYWSSPNKKTAWYYVPIMSDAPSAEFIKWERITTGSEFNEDGSEKTYQEILIDRFIDLVNQEYDRIMEVRQRDAMIQSGDKSIIRIANFDIKRDKKGEIESLGGAEFKFLPSLNSTVYSVSGNNRKDRITYLKKYGTEEQQSNPEKYADEESFIEALGRIKEFGTPSQLDAFLRTELAAIINEDFENTYEQWSKIGLFEELENGRYRYLPFQGQKAINQRVAAVLSEIQKELGSKVPSEISDAIKILYDNKPYNSDYMQSLLYEVQEAINLALDEDRITPKTAERWLNGLTLENNAKEALREYYWNSSYMTSQIIEVTTTDLAYYKNLADFQKRFKEIHAPSQRLNTHATFRGKRVGKQRQRVLVLKDSYIKSSIIDDVKRVFDEEYKKGKISKVERDYIISQYERVNVADAQAYRSLDSYRAVMVMTGKWTDEMETAYEHLSNNNWNTNDFNVIWQTIKPFYYGQESRNSGVLNKQGVEIKNKVPAQHKNSEYLLLAMYNQIAGPLGISDKLKAINDFMIKYDIDVVQFESADKVAGHGAIDLSNVSTYDEVFNKLKADTDILSGGNPNVIHESDYSDYGIQTPTPEHLIDAIQLVGTQIRKLIAADLPDSIKITINNKTYTKKEWLDFYNKVVTENIIDSFKQVREEFSNPKKIEKLLQSEIRSNSKYTSDIRRACTLNEKGQFNIPLYDPVISNMVQNLMNSIIKSRITKQKIKGGSLIQVSNYGLTNDLRIIWEGEGDNRHIAYMEVYMPAYSKELYSLLIDKDSKLDINKLPEDLRKAIGYRVPTESKYSMVPIMIKGFLPQQTGSAIMLPAEITTLSGSDFDKHQC